MRSLRTVRLTLPHSPAVVSALLSGRRALPAPALAAVTVLGVAAMWLNLIGLPDTHELIPATLSPEMGNAYVAFLPRLPPFVSPGDSASAPTRSNLRLFESNTPLVPHTLHEVIRHGQGGTYSHWGDRYIIFSASDHSDPRSNGRSYRIERRLYLSDWLAFPLMLLAAIALLPAARTANHRIFVETKSLLALIFPNIALRGSVASVPKLAFRYCVSFAILFFGAALVIGYQSAPRFEPALGANMPLPSRVQFYLNDPSPYSVIYLGDSHTYCAMHPEIIEKYLPELHGLNLSNFTHWFPTQYSMINDIVARIPKNTIVVWSISHVNFDDQGVNSIQRVYPMSLAAAVRLLAWGTGQPGGLFDNLAYYHWPLYLPIALRELHAAVDTEANQPFVAAGSSTQRQSTSDIDQQMAQEIQTLSSEALSDPNVVYAEVTTDQGRPTSVVKFLRRGGYYRTEMDPQFFRRKQAETASGTGRPAPATEPWPTYPLQWRLFTAMLDLFELHRVHLIVNELEEAPYTYQSKAARDAWRRLMFEHVRPEVERRGFLYARADLDALEDDDYFDYNHMNSKGIAKYSPMIAAILAKAIGR